MPAELPAGREVSVERVPPAVTYPLRQRVLRPGRPPDAARLAIDDDPRTATFAAIVPPEAGAEEGDGTEEPQVVGTAIVYPEGCPWLPDRPGAWRLRGMATEPARRSAGVGTRVLRAALDHVRAQGGELVWCNARTPARRFYERAGFTTHGDPWEDPEIGPHVAMWCDLTAGSAGSAGPAGPAGPVGPVGPTRPPAHRR